MSNKISGVQVCVDSIRTQEIIDELGFDSILLPQYEMHYHVQDWFSEICRIEYKNIVKECTAEWIILVPDNSLVSIRKMLFLEHILRSLCTQHIVRMYPFPGHVLFDGSSLDIYCQDFQKSSIKTLLRACCQASIEIQPEPYVTLILPEYSENFDNQAMNIEQYCDRVSKLLVHTQITFADIRSVWITHEYFYNALYSEIIVMIMIGLEQQKIFHRVQLYQSLLKIDIKE